ncbi:hypothetical protein C7M84_021765 [Penaeus vannamei]|uniref:Uncharacterized protein n=1 Tax=Penaeus vannamei TaxID=6689 RepID=A0A3R7LP72_PENVA|nr:hypothetical protein C7M84_021765 [Penaeus vannamei]
MFRPLTFQLSLTPTLTVDLNLPAILFPFSPSHHPPTFSFSQTKYPSIPLPLKPPTFSSLNELSLSSLSLPHHPPTLSFSKRSIFFPLLTSLPPPLSLKRTSSSLSLSPSLPPSLSLKRTIPFIPLSPSHHPSHLLFLSNEVSFSLKRTIPFPFSPSHHPSHLLFLSNEASLSSLSRSRTNFPRLFPASQAPLSLPRSIKLLSPPTDAASLYHHRILNPAAAPESCPDSSVKSVPRPRSLRRFPCSCAALDLGGVRCRVSSSDASHLPPPNEPCAAPRPSCAPSSSHADPTDARGGTDLEVWRTNMDEGQVAALHYSSFHYLFPVLVSFLRRFLFFFLSLLLSFKECGTTYPLLFLGHFSLSSHPLNPDCLPHIIFFVLSFFYSLFFSLSLCTYFSPPVFPLFPKHSSRFILGAPVPTFIKKKATGYYLLHQPGIKMRHR